MVVVLAVLLTGRISALVDVSTGAWNSLSPEQVTVALTDVASSCSSQWTHQGSGIMSGCSRGIWLLVVAASSLVPRCGGGDGTGSNPAPPAVDGVWVLQEVLTEAANAISCQDNGVLTIVQTAGGFSADYQQTGACVSLSGLADNSGALSVSNGSVTGTVISFTQPGPIPCT